MPQCSWLTIGACAALLGCAPQLTPQQRAVEEQAVKDRLQSWDKAMNNRWPDSLAAVYEHSSGLTVVWPDGHRARGWEQEQTSEREFYSVVSYMNLGVQDPTVELLSPDVALVTFHHSTDVMVLGKRQPVASGQATQVWVKDATDHQWRIHASQISNAAAPLPPPPSAPVPARRR